MSHSGCGYDPTNEVGSNDIWRQPQRGTGMGKGGKGAAPKSPWWLPPCPPFPFLCLFGANSLPRLSDRVDDDRFAAFHDFDPALERSGHVFRIRDRADTGQAIRLGHLRVI